MSALLFSLASFFSTSFGGLFALRYRNRLRLIMGFTAGVLVGLVIFDLLPEIFQLIHAQHISPTLPMVAMMLGFLAFYTVEKLTLLHQNGAGGKATAADSHPQVGLLSALALSGHSFLDGVGIGLGFQVSTAAGIVVAIAVIAHDFSDGLNTVTLMLVNHNSSRRAVALLALDAVAPVLGTISTFYFTISGLALPLYVGFFAGFLLYIGASDILPAAHKDRSSLAAVALTIVGAAFAFAVTRFV